MACINGDECAYLFNSLSQTSVSIDVSCEYRRTSRNSLGVVLVLRNWDNLALTMGCDTIETFPAIFHFRGRAQRGEEDNKCWEVRLYSICDRRYQCRLIAVFGLSVSLNHAIRRHNKCAIEIQGKVHDK